MKRLILVAPLAALVGCAPMPHLTAHRLEGTAWQIVSLDGVPARSASARIDFLSDRVAATVGCNHMGGSALYKPNRIVVGEMIQTEMYCDGLMAQEQALGELLQAGPRFDLGRGMLRLEGGKHRAELRLTDPRKV